ncbi:MAG: NADH-quinone oxidoreductase subunit NuoG [bacterium]|nr:NADH-quinone oxidoreductase subunit NuoG [bacterium]
MPTIFIDNKPFEVKLEHNLLQAVLSLGINLPYFCWHPSLGSVGSCRQCAVQHYKDENDTVGRMVMSCMTPVAPDMRISVDDSSSKKFRADIAEWMMTNHPHDCPVCDEGGECHLQDMTLMTGHNYRRYRFKKRTFNNQNLGPFITHEMNRCITCYRCVRYYRDVAGGTDLDAFSSSNHVYFGRSEDGTLESEFSGNLAEICPTGVFTDKPFKAFFNRKWDLQMAPSVCQLCSLGCNIIPGERFQSVRRVQNKFNYDVNDYYLCDRGRFGHSFVNSNERLLFSHVKTAKSSVAVPLNEDELAKKIKKILDSEKKVIGIGSPRASLESNFALQNLVGKSNFYDGLSANDSKLMKTVEDIVGSGPALTASMRDIKEADGVLVLGEDILNTAPRLALAIRQNAIVQAQKKAGVVGIPAWHDLAVRNYVQEKNDSIITITPTNSKLEDVAHCYIATPTDITRIGYAIAHELNPVVVMPSNMSKDHLLLARKIAVILRKTKNPVIISGTGLQSQALLEASANIAWALKTDNCDARICLAVPESNNMGLQLLNPNCLSDLIAKIEKIDIDVAIILENDLSRRLNSADFKTLFEKISKVIVIDSIQTQTTKKASLAVACAAFTESTGTLVNNEGRVQRFYSVFERKEKIKDSWCILNDWKKIVDNDAVYWKNLDQITDAMGQQIELLSIFDETVYRANFRIDEQKIPRETQGYSGRTAMNANVTLIIAKPPNDINSPLAYTMEGFDGHPPSTLTPFFWAPGWNSVQSLNKYQKEVGGEYKRAVPVVRVFDGRKNIKLKFYNKPPTVFEPKENKWEIFPRYYIFGSEERAAMSLALSKKISLPSLGMNEIDAKRIDLMAGSMTNIEIDDQKIILPLVICPELPSGIAMMSFGLPDSQFVELPSYAHINLARSEA